MIFEDADRLGFDAERLARLPDFFRSYLPNIHCPNLCFDAVHIFVIHFNWRQNHILQKINFNFY